MIIIRTINRIRRRRRIRAKIIGTAERPRLCVHKSLRHLRAQLINDAKGRTLLAVSTTQFKAKTNLSAAEQLGVLIAERALSQGIKTVVFDRGGYAYHGQVQAVAEAARAGGLTF